MKDSFDRCFVDIIFEKEEEIDVRLRMNSSPPVTADRKKCESGRGLAVAPEILDDGVDLRADVRLHRSGRRIFKETIFKSIQKGLQLRSCRRHASHNGHLNMARFDPI